jgi:hypothetical protein
MLMVMIISDASAQTLSYGRIEGTARDTTGGALHGVTVELRARNSDAALVTQTDRAGRYQFDVVAPGEFDIAFTLINFASYVRPGVRPQAGQTISLDVVLQLTLSADVTVTGRHSFTNLADVDTPAESLIGIADAASEGAITMRQLETRPVMRAAEVLETVPGLIISQHSGEGKANQYYLRGFNLDHGTDFSTTIAGIPVNMPTHAHGHGYTDANFLLPELVNGVQFKKGPYYAEEGDFSAAGSVNVNYVSVLDSPMFSLSTGAHGWRRVFAAATPKFGRGHLLGAIELNRNDGPWTLDDDFRKVNGVVRYTEGAATAGFSLTGMFYRGDWRSTDQVPRRALESGALPRFGHIDPTNGGSTHRYSVSADSQWARVNSVTRSQAYFVDYALNLFSNFTYYLDDPVRGDQFEQADRRKVAGARVTHRTMARVISRPLEASVGVQIRRDDIGLVGLYRTDARSRFATTREDSVNQTSAGLFGQVEYQWSPLLRTTLGLRGDVYRIKAGPKAETTALVTPTFRSARPHTHGLASPKLSAVIGPWNGTEVYANAGYGFHSNDARTVMGDDNTPLVRARGAEVGVRTVRIPHVQSTVALWHLALDSELVFVGDAGSTEASRPSRRAGIEWATYASPRRWLSFDGDVAISRATFTDLDPAGDRIPGSVQSVISFGVSIHDVRRISGSVRLRYFGPRPLIEDDSVRSNATSLLSAQAGYRIGSHSRVVVELFNLLNETASDIDYFYTSRLRDEPATGIADVHTHPALPRGARATIQVNF